MVRNNRLPRRCELSAAKSLEQGHAYVEVVFEPPRFDCVHQALAIAEATADAGLDAAAGSQAIIKRRECQVELRTDETVHDPPNAVRADTDLQPCLLERLLGHRKSGKIGILPLDQLNQVGRRRITEAKARKTEYVTWRPGRTDGQTFIAQLNKDRCKGLMIVGKLSLVPCHDQDTRFSLS
ncbi:hypothetical protein FBZ92_14312 [Nitrospirillum viridazoti]|uniref:Uncharacterized protein n=1 Tax=Nitrospirillum amazonense TaxID=28077 RepID=A0A560HJZ2_9PROT|nr:hypothetical protein FBZ92_14312 [Nitrospirillum amazonense]